jgi:hypothetical protein
MLELTRSQMSVVERMVHLGFQVTRFPLYENAIAVVSGNCAALLGADASSGLSLLAPPSYLIENHLAVRITRAGRDVFVWKGKELEATPARLAELEKYASAIIRVLKESASGKACS